MSSVLSLLSWSPTGGYPSSTPTSLKSIDPSRASDLEHVLTQALASIATVTGAGDYVDLSEAIRGAEASLAVISAQNVLATATDALVQARATQVIVEAAYNLKVLAEEQSFYGHYLNRGGNIFFFVFFAAILAFNVGMLRWSRYHWYNITFVCGYLLQFLGFLGRILAFTDDANLNYYLLQYVSLSISPAFIMGGIYFLFAQNVVVHGRQYSVLKPMWYSYFFVLCDVVSLLVQAVGGAMASVAAQQNTDPRPGTWIMFGGVLFQLVAMTVFLVFWFEFIGRINFRNAKRTPTDSNLQNRTVKNWVKLWVHTKSVHAYKHTHLEQFYNPNYAVIRRRKLLPYYPLAISCAVLVIYIRCVYRVVELQQGFSGYLVTHEVFLMTLDALMIAISALIFIPFHPVFVFGKNNILEVATIKRNKDESHAVTLPHTEKDEASIEEMPSTTDTGSNFARAGQF